MASNGTAAAQQSACQYGVPASVTGTIKSIENALGWWIYLTERGDGGPCDILDIAVDEVPETCFVGGRMTATGTATDDVLADRPVLDQVTSLHCE
jgi:hypothetical protein